MLQLYINLLVPFSQFLALKYFFSYLVNGIFIIARILFAMKIAFISEINSEKQIKQKTNNK